MAAHQCHGRSAGGSWPVVAVNFLPGRFPSRSRLSADSLTHPPQTQGCVLHALEKGDQGALIVAREGSAEQMPPVGDEVRAITEG
jgi:hypothetical protein